MKKMNKKGKKGFTLIELVVVIAILGILAAILIPVVGGFIDEANKSANEANAKSLYNTAMMYLATTDGVPEATLDGTGDPSGFTKLYGTNWPDVKGGDEGDVFTVSINVTDRVVSSVSWSVGDEDFVFTGAQLD